MELVVIDAAYPSANFGLIRQVIAFGSNADVHVIVEGGSPADVREVELPPERVTLLPAGRSFGFQQPGGGVGSRSLLLFDGMTGLTSLDGRIQNLTNSLDWDRLLDVVTFGDPSRTRSFESEPVIDLSKGSVLLRPLTSQLLPAGTFLVGDLDETGRLLGHEPAFHANPGMLNFTAPSVLNPEPGMRWLLVAWLWLGMRRVERTASGGRNVAYHYGSGYDKTRVRFDA